MSVRCQKSEENLNKMLVNYNFINKILVFLPPFLVLALIPVLPYVLSLIVFIVSLPVRLASGIVSGFKFFKRKREERRNKDENS